MPFKMSCLSPPDLEAWWSCAGMAHSRPFQGRAPGKRIAKRTVATCNASAEFRTTPPSIGPGTVGAMAVKALRLKPPRFPVGSSTAGAPSGPFFAAITKSSKKRLLSAACSAPRLFVATPRGVRTPLHELCGSAWVLPAGPLYRAHTSCRHPQCWWRDHAACSTPPPQASPVSPAAPDCAS